MLKRILSIVMINNDRIILRYKITENYAEVKIVLKINIAIEEHFFFFSLTRINKIFFQKISLKVIYIIKRKL